MSLFYFGFAVELGMTRQFNEWAKQEQGKFLEIMDFY